VKKVRNIEIIIIQLSHCV